MAFASPGTVRMRFSWPSGERSDTLVGYELRSAFDNAASIAIMIMATETLITKGPEKTSPAATPAMPEYYADTLRSVTRGPEG